MPHVTIRLAARGDIAAVLDLWRRAGAAESTTDDAESLRRAVAVGALLVAEAGGAVVGSLIATFDGWRGNMYRLAVATDRRRAGIARALVSEGERRLTEQGCRRISALVLADEDDATAFWTAAGYEHQPAIARYVRTTDP